MPAHTPTNPPDETLIQRRTHTGRSLTLEMRTTATPQQVYDAWADPERIAQWFCDSAEGEARAGATVTWRFANFGYAVPYLVVEATPGRVFALGGELPGRPPFLFEITIARKGGETLVTLVNSGFLEGGSFDEEFEGVASGWELALGMLRYYLERHFGTPKQSFLVMRPVNPGSAELLPWFTDAERLTRWLTRDGVPAPVGERTRMSLRDGGVVDGETLAISRREVAMGWDAERMVLELKAFSMGPQSIAAIRGTAWGVEAERLAAVERQMSAALDRLVTQL